MKVFSAGPSLADYGTEVSFVPPPPHPWVGAEGPALPFSLRREDLREMPEGFPSKLRVASYMETGFTKPVPPVL